MFNKLQLTKNVSFLIFFIVFSFLFSKTSFAEVNKFITIVNPVRIAPYTSSSAEAIYSEYMEVKNRNLPATWLLTYDVLNNKDSVGVIRSFDKKQELGIFMEVSSRSADIAGVKYNKTDSWHRSNSIFLTGYSQGDREKLIDSVFERFKIEFGYYPVSVGAWWIDSYSLKYIKDKYNVVANLNVSDQLGTDGYTLQGTYYSTAYYPSNYNAAIPASTKENKLDIVTLRWAARDPLNGYRSHDDKEVTRFSTQDYFTIGLNQNYFESLLRKYTENDFSQITIGLEGDFPKETYSKDFRNQLGVAEKLYQEGRIKFSTMREFANRYRKEYPNYSPDLVIQSSDLLGGDEKIIWFQNPNYRIGIIYDQNYHESKIVDLRSYFKDFYESFYTSFSNQYDLNIIIPALIDNRLSKDSFIKLDTGNFVRIEEINGKKVLKFEKGEIVFDNKQINLGNIKYELGGKIDRDMLKVEGENIIPSEKYLYSEKGLIFREFLPKIPFALKSRIPAPIIYLVIFIALIIYLLSFVIIYFINKKYAFVLLALLLIYPTYRFINPIYVSQSEVDALLVLKKESEGNVLIYDKDCLRCKFSTKSKPAASEARKKYVKEMSGKNTIQSLNFVLAKNSDHAKEILQNLDIKYIYLSKYEEYIEVLSFNPLDLGITKIYENGNAVIYKVN